MKDDQTSRDPNNYHWAQDKEKFGYRMLMKMGWKEGKGLGANEDGDQSHVKILKKVDNRGIGAETNPFASSSNWLANTVAYDSLLSKLNQSYQPNTKKDEESSESSEDEEEKDRRAKGRRYRYHKLVRAKSTSNYSEQDKSAIFATSKKNSMDSDGDDAELTNSTKSSKDINQYFGDKMANNKNADVSPTIASDQNVFNVSLKRKKESDDESEEEKGSKKKQQKISKNKKSSKVVESDSDSSDSESSSSSEDEKPTKKKKDAKTTSKKSKKGKKSRDSASSSSDSSESGSSDDDVKSKRRGITKKTKSKVVDTDSSDSSESSDDDSKKKNKSKTKK